MLALDDRTRHTYSSRLQEECVSLRADQMRFHLTCTSSNHASMTHERSMRSSLRLGLGSLAADRA